MFKLLLTAFFILLSIGKVTSQEESNYLSKNNMILSDSSLNNDGLDLMDLDILKNQFFFVGEDHAGKKNGEIHSLLLKHIYSKKKQLYILYEAPLSLEHSIKAYIYEGDTIEYQYLYGSFTYMPEEEMYFLKQIRSLVKKGYNIKISTIDIENNWNLTIKRLQELIPSAAPPVKIEKVINSIKNAKFIDSQNTEFKTSEYNSFHLLEKKLEKDLKTDSKLYSEYLKENYNEFEEISKRFFLGIKFDTGKIGTKNSNAREVEMYSNIIQILKQNPNDTYYGGFGFFHTTLSPMRVGLFRKQASLASMLNNKIGSPVKGKICSTAIDYVNYKTGFNFFFMNPIYYPQFLKYSNSPLTMFKLDGENTPFKDMAEKFQYIVINKY